MISLELGRALREAGLAWQPRDGDHFVIPDRDLDDRVFVISHMVVEQVHTPSGPLLAFNGTTEWALDSIAVDEVLWLPLEHQLRELLGEDYLATERLPAADGEAGVPEGYAVTVRVDGAARRVVDTTVAGAYARALLVLLSRP